MRAMSSFLEVMRRADAMAFSAPIGFPIPETGEDVTLRGALNDKMNTNALNAESMGGTLIRVRLGHYATVC